MANFIIGFIIGVAVCTISFKEMAEFADSVQTAVKENTKRTQSETKVD
jgi:hypothetical protein